MSKNNDALTVLRAAVQDLALAGFQTDSVSDAVEAFAELHESCRPAAGPDGWSYDEYKRFVIAFSRIGGAA